MTWRVEIGDGRYGGYESQDEAVARDRAERFSLDERREGTGRPVYLFHRPAIDRATRRGAWPRRLLVAVYRDGEEHDP